MSLDALVTIQEQLFTTRKLIESQIQEENKLVNGILSFSNNLICELRQLSLVRLKILDGTQLDVYKFIESQILNGLEFSALEYCPKFIESNRLNRYITFITYLRRDFHSLSQVLFYYGEANPAQSYYVANSIFLSIFQQGWCQEEDMMISQVLCNLVDLQLDSRVVDMKKRKMKLVARSVPVSDSFLVIRNGRMTSSFILTELEPFASYLISYLFNCGSFSYLQSALNQIVSILHSLSSLRVLRSNFNVSDDSGDCTQIEYWRVICKYAKTCFDSLMDCIELLPFSVTVLFEHIMNHPNGGEEKCIVLFFEGFINKALDNPSILGLLPWHPDSSGWSPSKDISTVFRAKYSKLLHVKYYNSLLPVLEKIPEFQQLDFKLFIYKLCDSSMPHNVLISETELLSANSNFPKEIILTPMDLLSLKEAAESIPDELKTLRLKDILDSIGKVPELDKTALEHFKMVLQRENMVIFKAQNVKIKSLFNLEQQGIERDDDPFAEIFCSTISTMPRFSDYIKLLNPVDGHDFIAKMRIIIPYFICEEDFQQVESVLYFVENNIGIFDDLIKRVSKVSMRRNQNAKQEADKISTLNSQYKRITGLIPVIKEMRENVQTYLLYIVAMEFVNNQLSYPFQLIMSKAYDFMKNFEIFNSSSIALVNTTLQLCNEYKIEQNHVAQIIRILFFKMTENITLNTYEAQDRRTWKRAVIIEKIIENNRQQLVSEVTKTNSEEFQLRLKYLERAADLLGHVRGSSGLSFLLYYVEEFVSMISALSKRCKELTIDQCILWAMLNSKARHIYAVNKFIDHFILGNSIVDFLLTSTQNQQIGLFSSGVCLLNRACAQFDARITSEWD